MVLRQTQTKHTALVRMYHPPELVGIEAVDLHGVSWLQKKTSLCYGRTRISPPWVPAKMECEETASARMDLSCFMRCARAGARSDSSWPVSARVGAVASLCGGAAAGMVSLGPESTGGVVPAWSRVRRASWRVGDDGGAVCRV